MMTGVLFMCSRRSQEPDVFGFVVEELRRRVVDFAFAVLALAVLAFEVVALVDPAGCMQWACRERGGPIRASMSRRQRPISR